MVNMEKETKEILEENLQEKKKHLKKLMILSGKKLSSNLSNGFVATTFNSNTLSNCQSDHYSERSVSDLTSHQGSSSQSTTTKQLKEFSKNLAVVDNISGSLAIMDSKSSSQIDGDSITTTSLIDSIDG